MVLGAPIISIQAHTAVVYIACEFGREKPLIVSRIGEEEEVEEKLSAALLNSKSISVDPHCDVCHSL